MEQYDDQTPRDIDDEPDNPSKLAAFTCLYVGALLVFTPVIIFVMYIMFFAE
jgi:hypothetical protein